MNNLEIIEQDELAETLCEQKVGTICRIVSNNFLNDYIVLIMKDRAVILSTGGHIDDLSYKCHKFNSGTKLVITI